MIDLGTFADAIFHSFQQIPSPSSLSFHEVMRDDGTVSHRRELVYEVFVSDEDNPRGALEHLVETIDNQLAHAPVQLLSIHLRSNSGYRYTPRRGVRGVSACSTLTLTFEIH